MKFIVTAMTTAVIDLPEDDPQIAECLAEGESMESIQQRLIDSTREYYEQEISGSMLINENEVNIITVFKLPDAPAIVTVDDLENL